ncbi:MAG: pseudouridine synthase [Syntrophomonadaceae bacterium]
MRLARYLANAGISSRRKAEALINQGRVKVNEVTVKEKGFIITPGQDMVKFDGHIVTIQDKIYILLNKPAGYISSVYDPQGRPIVLDLLKDIKQRVYPVGRLDYDTEGLLLLSNDGEFTNLMLHPRYGMTKTYQALVYGKINEEALNQLRNGIKLDDGITAPAGVRILNQYKNNTCLEIKIHEGRKRQVKRMCIAVGHPLINLKRTAIEELTIKGVPLGQYRFLNEMEVKSLINKALFLK